MTHNIISHDMSPGAHPANHLGGFDQWTKVRILEQEFCRNGGPVGGVSRWGWFIGTANDVFTGKTLDAVGAYDEICFNDLAGFEGEGGYGGIHGYDAAASANGDARIALCELVEHAMKVGSLCSSESRFGRRTGNST